MTQPYDHDKLPTAFDARQPSEAPPPLLPDPANFAPPATQQTPAYPDQPYDDPRFAQVRPSFPHPHQAYPQPIYQPPQPVMPVVNVTQNNMGGGYVQVRRGPNHGLHLILTVLSCGLWAPVWILVWVVDAMGRK